MSRSQKPKAASRLKRTVLLVPWHLGDWANVPEKLHYSETSMGLDV